MALKELSSPKSTKSKLRQDHNRELIRRMRNGEPLTSFDSFSSWFPPRPIIDKDKKALDRLYGENEKDEAKKSKEPPKASSNTKHKEQQNLQIVK